MEVQYFVALPKVQSSQEIHRRPKDPSTRLIGGFPDTSPGLLAPSQHVRSVSKGSQVSAPMYLESELTGIPLVSKLQLVVRVARILT